jgi:hypothetical protein
MIDRTGGAFVCAATMRPRENAIAVGQAGRGALTLDDSFRTTWRSLRDAGVLTTPPPEVSPIDPVDIASLARTDRAVAERPRSYSRGGADRSIACSCAFRDTGIELDDRGPTRRLTLDARAPSDDRRREHAPRRRSWRHRDVPTAA